MSGNYIKPRLLSYIFKYLSVGIYLSPLGLAEDIWKINISW
jgi:hypothetical protein